MSRACVGAAVLLALGLPGCKSGQAPTARPGAPVPPSAVQELVGQARILRHRGDERRVSISRDEVQRLSGGCDAVVEVKQASLQGGTLRLSVAHLGRPRLPGRESGARRRPCVPARETVVEVSRLGPEAGQAGLDAVLAGLVPTPEQYLRAHGATFDRPPAAPEGAVADADGASAEERSAARQVTAWPVLLMAVDPDVPRPPNVPGRENEVEFAAVVGTDGRLHAPRLLTPLSGEHLAHVTRALGQWRYVPARAGDKEVPARITARTALRLY